MFIVAIGYVFLDNVTRYTKIDLTQANKIYFILAIGHLTNCISGSCAFFLNMTGNEISTLRITAVSVAFNILVSLILIPQYGEIGAAVALMVSTVFTNVTMAYFTVRKTGISSSFVYYLFSSKKTHCTTGKL